MSPMAMTIFINPLPTLNKCCKLNSVLKTPISSTSFCILKQSATRIFYKKSLSLDNGMLARAIGNGIFSMGDGQRTNQAANASEEDALIDNDVVSLHQSAGEIHLFFNRLSKWLVTIVMGGLILIRRDPLAIWAVNGIMLNHLLSNILKRILNQERPVSQLRSDPGMPSSHAQSIFYALVFVSQSVIEWKGLTGATAITSVFILIFGSYLSWLRVMLQYHTTNQVVVGAIVGSVFSVLWIWTWDTIGCGAYNSNLWVRILIFIGITYFILGSISGIISHWKRQKL